MGNVSRMFVFQSFVLTVLLVNIIAGTPVKDKKYFRVATLYHEPFVTSTNNSDNGRLEGFLIDLMGVLASKLKISLEYYIVRDGKYGHTYPNGSWSGIIGELVNHKADIGLAGLTITPKRMKAVRFSVPFLTTGIVGLGRKSTFPHGQEDLDVLIKMSQQNKLVLGTLQGGSTTNFFRDSTIPQFVNVDEEMQKHPEGFVTDYDEGVRKVRSSTNTDYIFFGEKLILEHAASQEPCDLKVLSTEPLNTINYGIAFVQNFSNSLFEQFNAALLDLQTFGIVQLLKQRWTTNQCKMTVVPESSMPKNGMSQQFDDLILKSTNSSDETKFPTSQRKWKIVANLTEQ